MEQGTSVYSVPKAKVHDRTPINMSFAKSHTILPATTPQKEL